MSIILCGLPGCGKTTYGKILAENCGLKFVDTDRLLEKAFGLTCREIFCSKGEQYFRDLEKKVVNTLQKNPSNIIALGGGTLLDHANTIHLKSLGKMVYLYGPWEFLYERTIRNGIPGYLEEENPREAYKELAANREPVYEKAAEYRIDISENTTEQVLNQLRNIGQTIGK